MPDLSRGGILLAPTAVVDSRLVHINRSPARGYCLAALVLGARALGALPLDALYFALDAVSSMLRPPRGPLPLNS